MNKEDHFIDTDKLGDMDLVMNFDTDECLVTAMFDKGNRNDTMEAIDNIIPFLKGDADMRVISKISSVRLKGEVLQLRDKVKHLTSDVEFYKGKIRDMSVKTELLQEKADDLERVKRYAGAEQIDTIIGKVKEQERMEQQARQYNRSYGAR